MPTSNSDPIWDRIRGETATEAAKEPILASFLHATILNHNDLESALSFHLAKKLKRQMAVTRFCPAYFFCCILEFSLQVSDGLPDRLVDFNGNKRA